jgi:hypothetical protein
LPGETAGEADKAGTGAVRQSELGLWHFHAARDDVDNSPKPARGHAVDREPHHLDRTQHHVVECRDPIVARPVAEIAGQRPLRIVHQDIGSRTSANHGGAAGWRGQVGCDSDNLYAGRLRNLGAGAFQHVARACNDREIDALPRQRQRASLAETTAGAADQRAFASYAEVHLVRQAATAARALSL